SDRRFDAIIIGAGQAGPALAGRLAEAGMAVALVERHLGGGTCVNTGCMPTKTLVASARAAHQARRADLGVEADNVRVNFARVKARADKVAEDQRRSLEDWLAGLDKVALIRGHACFEGPDRVRVGEDVLTAPKIFINVGGRANVPDMPGVGEVPFLDNSSLLALDRLPAHLLIVGGSYIGLEFAQIYRRLGSEVTVVERAARLIPREDAEISEAIREALEAEGIAIRTGAECIGLAPGPSIHLNCEEGPPDVTGSHVLLAVGRRPNTDDLGLDAAGVAADARGYIQVDNSLATNVPGIWALGECNGHGAFTHSAYNDFEIIAANLLDGEQRRLSDRIPACALYVDPPLGRAGMSEAEGRKSGRPLLLASRPMSKVGRAIEKGETRGLMKLIADAETRQILGAAILGPGGDEAIHGIIDLMQAKATIDVLQWAVPIHPNVSELLPTLARGLRPAS
ncbi:MAG: FAD-containing oxidoreductase, partial [Sphingosinicella sp.]|uniref:FAD-containing oxidoreductase n=1 Tax=Sphingosinicella sp. TaxID=1917971 RepID=UPI004037AC9E